MAELAAFQLRGAARIWIDTSPLINTWEEFQEAFLGRFLPEGTRDAKRQAFEDLWMTPDMTVTEFELLYTDLAQYAHNIVPTERDKIKRFIHRLPEPLFAVLSPQVNQFQTLAQAADSARVIEARREYDRTRGLRVRPSSGKYQGGHWKKQKSRDESSSIPAIMGAPPQSTYSQMNISSTASG